MAEKLIQIHLESNDVTSTNEGYKLEEVFQQEVDELKIEFQKSLSTTIVPTKFQTIELWEGYTTSTDKKRFKGLIVDIEETQTRFIITAYSEEYRAILKDLRKHYKITGTEGGVGSEIFIDMMQEAGISADNTSVIDTGSTLLIQDYLVQGTDVFERAQNLADRYNYQWYFDPEIDKARFEPRGYTVNSNNIVIGGANNNVIGGSDIKFITDAKSVINEVTVEGAFDSVVEPPQLENGTGAQTEYILDFIPDSIQVFVDSGAGFVEQTVGKEDVLTASIDCLLDKANQKITFQSGSIPPSGTGNVKFIITRLIATPVTLTDETAVTADGLTSSTTLTFSDIVSVADAELVADNFLQIRKNPFVSTVVKITSDFNKTAVYNIGELLTLDDNLYDGKYSGNYLITKIIRRRPEQFVEIHLGNKEWKEFNILYNNLTRLKRLEEQFKSEDVILNLLREFSNILSLIQYIEVLKENINDTFTVNHPINSLTNQGQILDVMNTTSSNWSVGGTITSNSDNSDLDFVQVQTGSLKINWTASGAGTLTNTTSFGDLSTETGTSSGSPTQGTVGIWIYLEDSLDVTAISLDIGSSASDLVTASGVEYGSTATYGDETFTMRDGWNYIVFRLNGLSPTGTPDWTAVDYVKLSITTVDSGTFAYIDYFTISKSNFIGLNGVGKRYTFNSYQTTEVGTGSDSSFPWTFPITF